MSLRKFIILMVLLFFLHAPGWSQGPPGSQTSSGVKTDKFKILLASGWSVSCVKYWYEGDQILLTTASGITFGFGKQEVVKIENLEEIGPKPTEPPKTTEPPKLQPIPFAPPPVAPVKPTYPAAPFSVPPAPKTPVTPPVASPPASITPPSPTPTPVPPGPLMPATPAKPLPPAVAKPPAEEPEIIMEEIQEEPEEPEEPEGSP